MSKKNQLRLPIINGLPDLFKEGIIQNYFKIAYQSDPILWSSAIAVKKRAIESIGGFPKGIRAGEDLLTWARLAAHFDIAYTTQPKATFCRWDTSEHDNPRVPDSHNRVAEALKKLLIDGDKDKIDSLERYIAYWHKIRVAIYLRLDEQKLAKEEFIRMSEFSEKDFKYIAYYLAVNIPQLVNKLLMKTVRYFKKI